MNTVLLIDDILSGGSYASDNLVRQQEANETELIHGDVLKMLEQEYIRYLSDGKIAALPTAETQHTAVKHRQSELFALDSGQTMTEHLLGKGRMIDKLLTLPELVQDVDDFFSEPPQQSLLFRLSPLEITVNQPESSPGIIPDKFFLFPGDKQ